MNFPALILALIAGPMNHPAAASALPGSLPLTFDHVALGNVSRVLSARYHAPLTLYAGAKAPISGDFSKLDLDATLAEVARQAGLVVKPLGKSPTDGYALQEPPKPDPAAILAAAAKRRDALLKERALLDRKSPAPDRT